MRSPQLGKDTPQIELNRRRNGLAQLSEQNGNGHQPTMAQVSNIQGQHQRFSWQP